MSEEKELTYILGAGASFESMPVVRTFADRFSTFAHFLNKCSDLRFNKDACTQELDNFKTAFLLASTFHQDFIRHYSFDNFFKKLFHTGKKPAISLGKKILHLYFLWEHLENPSDKSNLTFKKQSSIDKRYDALIAGLLCPDIGVSKTFCKVNFITWNYDLNLLESLKAYFYPNRNFAQFFKDIKTKNKNILNIKNQISIVNMNGYFYSSCFNDFQSSQGVDSKKIIAEKISNNYFNYDIKDKDAELIKFAWESESAIANIAKDKICNSNNVIVVGYTFPLYNRLLDMVYFNGSSLYGKNLYIQDPNALELKLSLVENFNIRPGNPQYAGHTPTVLKSIANCDNFYVPNNIFTT